MECLLGLAIARQLLRAGAVETALGSIRACASFPWLRTFSCSCWDRRASAAHGGMGLTHECIRTVAHEHSAALPAWRARCRTEYSSPTTRINGRRWNFALPVDNDLAGGVANALYTFWIERGVSRARAH